jgi:integral membrane protein
MNTIKLFRWVALAEGISFILLLGIAMPLKYIWGNPAAVKMLGMAHGVLFVAYIALAFEVYGKLNKRFSWFVYACLLSIIPFGTFYLDRSLRKTTDL